MKRKIHLFGASGSGVSTLGKLLASKLNFPFYDADDYYWIKTDPPFLEANPIEIRKQLLRDAIIRKSSWVLSGSLVSWGDSVQNEFDLAIYIYASPEVRIQRIKQREQARFFTRIEVGGDMFEAHLKFLAWAAQYDQGLQNGRSKLKHETWIKTLKCPVVYLDGNKTIEENLLIMLKILGTKNS
jgi:adenylate kinase family enzyme